MYSLEINSEGLCISYLDQWESCLACLHLELPWTLLKWEMKWKIEIFYTFSTLRISRTPHSALRTTHSALRTLHSTYSTEPLACVAGVKGEGDGERENERKMAGGWREEGKRNVCMQNPHFLIFASAGGCKILIG